MRVAGNADYYVLCVACPCCAVKCSAVGGVACVPACSVECDALYGIVVGHGKGERAAVNAQLRTICTAPETIRCGCTLSHRRDGQRHVVGSQLFVLGDVAFVAGVGRCGHIHSVEVEGADCCAVGLDVEPLYVCLVDFVAAVVDRLDAYLVPAVGVEVVEIDKVFVEVVVLCESVRNGREVFCQLGVCCWSEYHFVDLAFNVSVNFVEELAGDKSVALNVNYGNVEFYGVAVVAICQSRNGRIGGHCSSVRGH